MCSSCRYIDGNVHPDLRQIVSSDGRTIPVEKVRRDVAGDLPLLPQLGKRKVYVIEATYLNEHGQNALLKSLEEPPAFARFILTVERPDSLLPTILSRAQLIALEPCSDDDLLRIFEREQIHGDEAYIRFLAAYAGGTPGRALQLATSSWFSALRAEAAEWYFKAPKERISELLTEGYAFLESNKEHFTDVIAVFQSLLRDEWTLYAGLPEEQVVNKDLLSDLTMLLPGTTADTLEKKASALAEAVSGAEANASFEGMASLLMLRLKGTVGASHTI